ncbi:hypothetical protein [uncultured Anaerococcus sp.]|uniref:hypothetical protein n=1 Tax=uncultured Anaerococcus sp. TaxID=293428 RepID=UPI00288B5EBE|nr:hypothetical protein [uncultured Anaerococcus sp.]
MKIYKKLAISLLAANFAFLGLAQTNTHQVYAAEGQNDQIKYDIQKKNLLLAISDSTNVVSSEVYNSYISADLQQAYLVAISQGKALLLKGDGASFDELRIATGNIKEAKAEMMRQADKNIKTIKLKEAISRNKITVNAAKLLLQTAPNKVAGVRDKLIQLINESERLIKVAEAIL